MLKIKNVASNDHGTATQVVTRIRKSLKKAQIDTGLGRTKEMTSYETAYLTFIEVTLEDPPVLDERMCNDGCHDDFHSSKQEQEHHILRRGVNKRNGYMYIQIQVIFYIFRPSLH